jgi:DNA-binding NarL/FixJ family response regulator
VHRMRILLADDNAALRQTVRQIIEENPRWRICGEAADGRTAVELARRLHPDIVILDYKMPLMNGVEAAHLIGSFLPHAAMVLFTGEATKAVVQQARGSGIGAVLSKAGHGYLRLLSFIDRVSSETQGHSASLGKRRSSKRHGPSDFGPTLGL